MKDIERIVERQRQFYHTGKTKDLEFRMKALKRLEAAIAKCQPDIEQALHEDLHKAPFESYMTEVGLVLGEVSYARKHLESWAKPRHVRTPLAQFPGSSRIYPEPYGVALVMAPWNYPFLLSMEPLVGALAAGNCCVVKPSAYAPATMGVIKALVEEAFPPCYVAVVEGGREENAKLLDQRFDYIFFTGGVKVGKLVMEKAARHLTPVTLELGGKSPCIVDETANLKLAAKRLVFGKFLNSGQTCVAPDYLLVHHSAKEELLGLATRRLVGMYGLEPLKNPDYPAMVNQKHYQRVMGLMDPGKVVWGGYGNPATLQIAPTIMDRVEAGDKVMGEEIFGPVLPVITFQDMEEAEAFVLSREKPLACYLFTSRQDREERLVKRLSFGGGCINDTVVHLASPYLPFGGVGQSGMGSYHGKASFDAFSHEKSLLKRYGWLDVPIRYQPYGKMKRRLMELFFRL